MNHYTLADVLALVTGMTNETLEPFLIGPTGYLDARFIPTEKVSHGVDTLGRKYITFCFKRTYNNRSSYNVCTAFQRYQTGSDIWVNASNYGETFWEEDYDGLAFTALLQLLLGDPMLIEENPYSKTNKKVVTYELVGPEEILYKDPEARKLPRHFAPRELDAEAKAHAEKRQLLVNGRSIDTTG